MILSMPLFNTSFTNLENEVPVLVVEDKMLYRSIVNKILCKNVEDELELEIHYNNKILDLSKDAEVIMDIFHLDLNCSKNLTKLYQHVKSEYVNEFYYLETSDLLQRIIMYMERIMTQSEFQLSYDCELDIVTLFKGMNLHFYCENDSYMNIFLDYLKVMSGFFHKKLFICTQFKQIFTESEQEQIYQYILYNKIELLLLESTEPRRRLEYEKYRIIDEQQCVID